MIETHGLGILRDGQRVLRDVSLSLPPEGITAIIGPNGAGKSTLLHALAGLLPPATGRVTLDGTDLAALSGEERALRLALLTQEQSVTARLSVADLVAFGRWPHHRGRPTEEDREAVAGAMAAFALEPLAERGLDTLSGGQRQRAFVAMAHAQTTPWILLDEPLAALDPRYAQDIMRRLNALSRPAAGARGIVLVIHDLTVAARFADRVVALKDGGLFGAGPLQELFQGEALSRLYDTPMEVVRVADRLIPIAA